jgi:RNA polymerase-associated protein RTF1
MPDHSGHSMVVDTYVTAAHGKASREWPFIMCSDRGFTEVSISAPPNPFSWPLQPLMCYPPQAEFNRYKTVCLSEGVAFPKKASLVNKIDDINRLVTRSWTEDELSEKLRRQNTLLQKYSGTDREHVQRQIDQARARHDDDAVARLQEKLDSMEPPPRLAFKTSLTPANKNGSGAKKPNADSGEADSPAKKNGANSHLSNQEKLALVNAENRRRNAEAVRKAQLAERAKAREIERAIKRGEKVEEDHSRRMRTRIKFVHDVHEVVDDKNGSGKNKDKKDGGIDDGRTDSAAGTPKIKPSASPMLAPHIAKLQAQRAASAVGKGSIPVIHRPLMDDEVIGAIDLDLEI